MKKVILITNIPAPYRVLQFNRIHKHLGDDFNVIYFRKKEFNRKWKIENLYHNYTFLNSTKFTFFNFTRQVFSQLLKNEYNIIIGCGFNPTIIIVFLWAKIKRKKFIVFTDSWLHSVNQLNIFQRCIRRLIIPHSDCSICVGQKGREFLLEYGAEPKTIFISPLAIDNEKFQKFNVPIASRNYDLIFSGQFIDRKMPFFVLKVIKELKKHLKVFKFLLIGSGPLEEDILAELGENKIDFTYPGFICQQDLPEYYSKAKILLFPTQDDPWGIVANEACAAGTPVLTCKNAGVAHDLIIDNFNGYVLPINASVWCKQIIDILGDQKHLEEISNNCRLHVEKFSLETSVKNFIQALDYCDNI